MSSRANDSKNVEVENLVEEASFVFEKCTRCGLCKSICPAFKTLLEERVSPRGHAIIFSEKILEKAVFECTLCRACEEKCPLHLKICDAILKSRQALVLKGKGTKKNEMMLQNIKKYGNIFGKDSKFILD